MAKPITHVTPENRVERWKKLWATPRKLSPEATDEAFDAFAEALVPRHMHKMFLKTFGQPKAKFGNRFFVDEAAYHNWDTKLSTLVGNGAPLEVTVIYGSPDRLEAHRIRGERRRTLRDVVIDDWHAGCAVVEGGRKTLFLFVEPKMRGCIVRSVVNENYVGEPDIEEEEEPVFLEPDPEPVRPLDWRSRED